MIWGQDYLLKQHKSQERDCQLIYCDLPLKPIHRNILNATVKGILSNPLLKERHFIFTM